MARPQSIASAASLSTSDMVKPFPHCPAPCVPVSRKGTKARRHEAESWKNETISPKPMEHAKWMTLAEALASCLCAFVPSLETSRSACGRTQGREMRGVLGARPVGQQSVGDG